jgi:hypothetical protein
MAEPVNLTVVDGSDRIYNTFPKVRQAVGDLIRGKYGIDLLVP